jgi:hypothetical protein
MRRTLPVVIALAAMLAGCASSSKKPTQRQLQRIDRALATAPGEAQPSTIVAADIALKQAAQETGQWSAFASFASPGARFHLPQGLVDATRHTNAQRNPAQPRDWEPRAVWMSCDGSVAVLQGRYTDPDGIVGNYWRVWQRQRDRNYRYVYNLSAADNPQPPRPKPEDLPREGEIVAEGLRSIRADIADCPERGAEMPAKPVYLAKPDTQGDFTLSRDQSLLWYWSHGPGEGERYFSVHLIKDGEWEAGLKQDLSLAPN